MADAEWRCSHDDYLNVMARDMYVPTLPRSLRWQFLVEDLSFLAYWSLTSLHWIPLRWTFKDYSNPIVMASNWSFLPIGLVLGITAAVAILCDRLGARQAARSAALVALALTHASGLMALAYWAIRRQFDWSWWTPNSYLLLYPFLYSRWAFKSAA